jgi:hypothetical protein
MVAFVVAALVLGTAATASAGPKKDSTARSSSSTTSCNGTPVIMQGLDCPQRPGRGEQEYAERSKHPRITAPGGSSYVAPLASRPPSLIPQPSVTPYVPPPISNPSERITQFNHSFPLNGGLGLNPTDRDSYIRYNFNNR